jgi:predicted ATPase
MRGGYAAGAPPSTCVTIRAVALTSLSVEGYRSVRALFTPLGRVNVVLGPNGSGKTNLYRSLALLVAAAQGGLARAIGREGGMASVMWAGSHRKQERRGVIVEAREEALSYRLELGLPIPLTPTMFPLDPEVKSEAITFREGKRKTLLMERKGPTAWMRDDDGRRVVYPRELTASESVLAQLRDRHRYPEVSAAAERMQGWRLYHHFRTDADAPLRQPQVGVSTHVLSSSGDDLAAALQTIREVGDRPALDEAVEDAFPGSRLLVEADGMTRVALRMRVPGIARPLEATELSDGTVRYLCLLAALLTPRPPELMALNEPETSLHPQLLAPLGRLVARAGRDTQLFVTTHARELADGVAASTGARTIELELSGGETRIVGQRLGDDEDD